MLKRLSSIAVSLIIFISPLAFASPSHAAVPAAPVITLTIGGDQMAYVEIAPVVGATTYEYSVCDTETGGACGLDNSGSSGSYSIIGPKSSLINGNQYWVEARARNADGLSSPSARMPVTPTTVLDLGAAAPTAISANGYDKSAQLYTSVSTGSFRAIVAKMFTASTGPNNTGGTDAGSNFYTPLLPQALNSSIITNGTVYYVSTVIVGTSGFSAWTPRIAVTPLPTPRAPFLTNSGPLPLSLNLTYTTPTAFDGTSMVITGYRIDYTLDSGATWVNKVADTGSTSNTYTVTGLLATNTYIFRVAAIVGGDIGAWSNVSGAITPTRNPQTVTWNPTNTSLTGTSGSIAPNATASTNGDGTLSYGVTNAGTTGCTVNSTSGVVTYLAAGTCEVAASATQTATYAAATKAVSFTITAPAPSGGGGSSAAEIETPATTPVPTPTPSVPTPLTPAPTTQPTATPGLPDNPVTQTTVASGLVLVSAEVAAATPPRVLKNEPTSTLRGAPRVAAQTGSAVSLVTTGLEANTTFTVKVKIGGKYVDLGLTETDANGLAQLPVFKANKAGEITVAIVNRATGETSYIKIKVNKKTKKN